MGLEVISLQFNQCGEWKACVAFCFTPNFPFWGKGLGLSRQCAPFPVP